jgi:hypothetical protein
MEEKTQFFDEKFNDILLNSKYLMMNQTSDIINDSKFSHIAFLGNTTVDEILSQITPMAGIVNRVVKDVHTQLFITKEVFEQNKKILNNNEHNYSIIDSYDEMFKGFVRVNNYYILANSANIHNKYYVYALFDSQSESNNNINYEFEFYGFVKLGYLINPRGYTEEEINLFELAVGFPLREEIREYVKKSPVIKYDNKLFHINLDTKTYTDPNQIENLKKPFGYIGEKTITNLKYISKYKTADSTTAYEQIENDEKTYMEKIEHGFLCIGLLKKHSLLVNDELYLKSEKKVYLLLNYETSNINYDFSIWVKSYDNKNIDLILENYDVENQTSIDNYDYDYSLCAKKDNIFQTLKCMENLSFV